MIKIVNQVFDNNLYRAAHLQHYSYVDQPSSLASL